MLFDSDVPRRFTRLGIFDRPAPMSLGRPGPGPDQARRRWKVLVGAPFDRSTV